MAGLRTLFFRNTVALVEGMKREFRAGLRPRALLFMGLDDQGSIYVACAEREADVSTLTVGEKLTLPKPFTQPLAYVDAIHPLGNGIIVVNGDRKLGELAGLFDVAAMATEFIRQAASHASSAAHMGFQPRVRHDSVIFGCTAHRPGSWWVKDDASSVPVHTHGFVEIVPTQRGLVSRRSGDQKLYFLSGHEAVTGRHEEWQPIYQSPLGNILMLERRVLGGRLFLSCEQGLIEVDLTDLPRVHELGQLKTTRHCGVVGRVSHGAFSIVRGEPTEWGFSVLGPATLIGTEEGSLAELSAALTITEESHGYELHSVENHASKKTFL